MSKVIENSLKLFSILLYGRRDMHKIKTGKGRIVCIKRKEKRQPYFTVQNVEIHLPDAKKIENLGWSNARWMTGKTFYLFRSISGGRTCNSGRFSTASSGFGSIARKSSSFILPEKQIMIYKEYDAGVYATAG